MELGIPTAERMRDLGRALGRAAVAGDRFLLEGPFGAGKTTFVQGLAEGLDVPTPVSDGTYLYVVNDRGIMFCLDARSGKEFYGRQRLRPGTYSGSPVLADGKIYITNEDGLTSVIKAGPTFEVLAENDFDDYTLSSPALSDGQIFFRTAKFLYCIGKRAV